MSFKKADLFPCNPATTRGESTRISSSKDKIAYVNGRTVIVRVGSVHSNRHTYVFFALRSVI
jgi:hypothetical protein